MKYIKKYEEKQNEPKKGDYVFINTEQFNKVWIENMEMQNNTGKILKLVKPSDPDFIKIPFDMNNRHKIFIIEFKYNLPNGKHTMFLDIKDILFYAKTKKELSALINAHKFNL